MERFTLTSTIFLLEHSEKHSNTLKSLQNENWSKKSAKSIQPRKTSALILLKSHRNKSVVINNTDKNVGSAIADNSLVIKARIWQSYDKDVVLLLNEGQ